MCAIEELIIIIIIIIYYSNHVQFYTKYFDCSFLHRNNLKFVGFFLVSSSIFFYEDLYFLRYSFIILFPVFLVVKFILFGNLTLAHSLSNHVIKLLTFRPTLITFSLIYLLIYPYRQSFISSHGFHYSTF